MKRYVYKYQKNCKIGACVNLYAHLPSARRCKHSKLASCFPFLSSIHVTQTGVVSRTHTHRIEDARLEMGTATQPQDRRTFVSVLAKIGRQCTPTMLTCKGALTYTTSLVWEACAGLSACCWEPRRGPNKTHLAENTECDELIDIKSMTTRKLIFFFSLKKNPSKMKKISERRQVYAIMPQRKKTRLNSCRHMGARHVEVRDRRGTWIENRSVGELSLLVTASSRSERVFAASHISLGSHTKHIN